MYLGRAREALGSADPMMLVMSQLPATVRSAIRVFAFYLGNGTLALDLLQDVDYLSVLSEGAGSPLEQTFAIFLNVLQVDADGGVTNEAVAGRRAAQWLRSFCEPGYIVEPPFEEWETALV